jgi:hypothetical protein
MIPVVNFFPDYRQHAGKGKMSSRFSWLKSFLKQDACIRTYPRSNSTGFLPFRMVVVSASANICRWRSLASLANKLGFSTMFLTIIVGCFHGALEIYFHVSL